MESAMCMKILLELGRILSMYEGVDGSSIGFVSMEKSLPCLMIYAAIVIKPGVALMVQDRQANLKSSKLEIASVGVGV